MNCFQSIYFRPIDAAKLQTHIGVSEGIMVHAKQIQACFTALLSDRDDSIWLRAA